MDVNNLSGLDGTRAGQGGAINKTVEYYMGLPYTIELWRAPEGGWVVQVKELPGCASQGETAEEALAMIQDAMLGWLEVALEMGDVIPEPRAEEDYSGKFVVRVPRSLHRQLVDKADREGVSLNQYINVTLAEAIGESRPAKVNTAAPVVVPIADSTWPGLSSVLCQVLTAAGHATDAGILDERLFADWVGQMLGQVEAAVAGNYARDALDYLDTLTRVLQDGASRSPAVASLYDVTVLLRRQIESTHSLEQGLLNQLRRQISGATERNNSSLAELLVRDERTTYPFDPAEHVMSESARW